MMTMSTTTTEHSHPHQHPMRFGARLREGGGVEFSLWAPSAREVALVLREPARADDEALIPAHAAGDGWWRVSAPGAGAGTRYAWRIGGELQVPDPASRFNPDGVHALSEVIDPAAFDWGEDEAWTGRPWHEAVIYELHVGTFTPEGTYAAAQAKLADLAALGITAIELMPLAAFPGRFGWGYDGVLPFAPHPAYGRPDDLKRFVKAAHALGLMVLLDVVYNHFGPDGNYLPNYAPQFFSDKHHTAWGAAVNFDGPGSPVVRQFFLDNALYWLREYRFDGLRFDAVHAMLDDNSPDIMESLSAQIRAALPERHVHLVLENDSNDPRRLAAPRQPGRFEGQWNGDLHHALHVLLTGEHEGYYGEYVDDTLGQLQRSLTHGLVWQGGPHNVEHAPPRRRCEVAVPLSSMVNFLQNHDQVGNRAFGERLTMLVDEAPLRLATALHLLNPTPPLLLMGEEWGATTPFLYFSDWQGDLRNAVTEGRRREFAHFSVFSDAAARERIPDPCEESTFLASKLDWASFGQALPQRWHGLYADLLQRRHRALTPRLPTLMPGAHESERLGDRALRVSWQFKDGVRLHACLNFSAQAQPLAAPLPGQGAQPWYVVGEAGGNQLGPWAGCWWWTGIDGRQDDKTNDKDI